MKVLHVSYSAAAVSADVAGGAEQVLAALDAALVASGWDSCVVAPEGSRVAGTLFPSGRLPAVLGPAERAAAAEAHAAAVWRALNDRPFDVIHLHGLDFERILPREHPPALVTLHLPPGWYAPGALPRRDQLWLACVSEEQARALPAGAPLAFVIPNGVSLERFRPNGAREPFALVLARIAPEKGPHLALDAARRAGVPLVVGGEVFPYPEHLRYLEAEIRPRLDAERRFVGPVAQREKARLLAAARCVVVPSLAPETSSLVAMEALASGTPVVARRVGALPEIVEHGRTGFLVDTVEEMAEAIRDAGRLSGADCRRAAESRFSERIMVDRYRAAYGRIVRGARGDAARPASPTVDEIEEIDGLAALESIADAWSDLADRDPRTRIFQRPEWLLAYCRAFVPSPWAVALWRGDRLAALAPLVVYPDGDRRIATLLGGGRSDWQDALVDPELAPDGAAVLLDRIARRRDRYDALLLERLPADGWLAQADVPPALCAAQEVEDEPCPSIALPADAEGLAARLAWHVARNVRQGRRRLGADAEFLVAGTEDVDAHLEALFAVHAARWNAKGAPGVLADERVRAFHADAARALAASGRLRAYRLVCGGRVASVVHGFQERERVSWYLLGFDPAFRRVNAGAVLLAWAAEDAIRRGARELDLLRGREPWKYDWGAVDRPARKRVLEPR